MVNKFSVCLLIFVLLSLPVLNSFTATSVKPVNAINTSVTWGNLNNYVYPNGTAVPFNYTEYPKQAKVCQVVSDRFSGSYIWLSADSYGYYTQRDYVYQTLDKIADPNFCIDFTHVFWVGDFSHPTVSIPAPSPYGYFGCFTYNSGEYVLDYEIYPKTTAHGDSKHHFTFMWTCANGGRYWTNNAWQNISGVTWPTSSPSGSPSNPNNQYGYTYPYTIGGSPYIFTSKVGMPLAWTGRSDMSLNGYSNPSGDYTFIGWENNSPFLGNTPPSGYTSTGYEYSYFIYHFYIGLMERSFSINEALDYAAEETFGWSYSFGNSVLNMGEWVETENKWFYCKLRVLGDGTMTLSLI